MIFEDLGPGTGPEARVTFGHRMSKKSEQRGQLRFGLPLGILARLQKDISEGVGFKKYKQKIHPKSTKNRKLVWTLDGV